MVCLALCLFMFTSNVFMFTGNVYAAEYPSPDDLSEEEKELLPYYHNGWTLHSYSDGGIKYKVYYLGKEIKKIDSFVVDGQKSTITTVPGYAVTDKHQLFIECEKRAENGDRYYCVARYDLDTGECKELNSISYLENIEKVGDLDYIVSHGNDVYLVFRKYQSTNNYTINVYKYDEKEDAFKQFNSIENVPATFDWIVYNTKNNVWTSIGHKGSTVNIKYFIVNLDFEKGSYSIGDDYNPDYYCGGREKFALYQVQKGIRYYWKEFSVLNDKTGYYDKYESLRKYDASTGKDIEILQREKGSFLGSFKSITHKGLIMADAFDAYIFTNEEKGIYKEIDGYYWHNNNDLWNYYHDGKAYPLYAPSDAKVTETTNTYTDRATIKWQAVSGASGYNVYVNGKKVNESLITENTYTVKGLNKGTEYDICVTSVNGAGESEKSSITKVKTGNVVLGDINNDQKVSIVDAMQIFHYVSGRNKKVNVTAVNADINGDGKVNITDAMKIFHYASGRNTEY